MQLKQFGMQLYVQVNGAVISLSYYAPPILVLLQDEHVTLLLFILHEEHPGGH